MTFKKINSKSAFASKSGSTSVSASTSKSRSTSVSTSGSKSPSALKFASASKSVFASVFASASAKTDGSKFCIDVENILDVTAGSMGPITRNQAKLLGQQASRVPSESATVFGLSQKHVKFPTKAAKENIAEMVERILAQLSPSTYEKSFASADNDVLSTGSTPRNMFSSHVKENQRYSSPPTMVMHAMVTKASSVKEQLVSLTRAIEGLTKYVQDQDDSNC
uniref:Cell wall surface anchor family protein, Ser rich n=1 Tax=Solanum tuberosum TaxID=4113 RepID=M1DPX9_SOLTU